jgi:hypothetical protein
MKVLGYQQEDVTVPIGKSTVTVEHVRSSANLTAMAG